MAENYSVTSAGVSPTEDREHRMRMYFIAMTLRVACVVSLFWVRGWWILLVAAGAVFLPWFAVMVGNAVNHGGDQAPEAPEPLQLPSAEPAPEDGDARAGAAADTLIVIDAEPIRRAESSTAPAPAPESAPAAAAEAQSAPAADAEDVR